MSAVHSGQWRRRATATWLGAISVLSCAAAPAPRSGAPPLVVGANRAAARPSAGAGIARVEVVVGATRLCVRVETSVRCVTGPPTASATKRIFDDAATFTQTGFGTACAVVVGTGEVHCVGTNDAGELGAAIAAPRSDVVTTVIGLKGATRIVGGNHHLCAQLADRSVRCWGKNESGQTGSSTSFEGETRILVRAEPVPSILATKLAASQDATCAITPARDVMCWGLLSIFDRSGGQAVSVLKPTLIEGLRDADDLAGGGEAVCAVAAGEVRCWGVLSALAPNPQPDTFHATLEPAQIDGLPSVTTVAVAGAYACAIAHDRRVWCWGRGDHGELGRAAVPRPRTGGTTDLAKPAPVEELPPAAAIAVGDEMACAVTTAEDVYCWGRWPHDYDEKDPNGLSVPIAKVPTRVVLP